MASNLYFRGCFEQLTPTQRDSLNAINADIEIVDRGCGIKDGYGLSLDELLNTYPFYNSREGAYELWEDVPAEWDGNPEIFTDSSVEVWNAVKFVKKFSYLAGDIVLLTRDDGLVVEVYQAKVDIPGPAGAFNPALWTLLGSVTTTQPVNVLPLPDLLSQYQMFTGGPYLLGEKFLVSTACGDAVCLYTTATVIPASTTFSFAATNLWTRDYCVDTGHNKCMDYQRKREPAIAYDLVEIGSACHVVEWPVPYKLRQPAPSQLNTDK